MRALEHAMREEDRAAASLRVHAFEDMLEESVISTALGWGAEEVTSPLVVLPRVAVPLFDGVRWICQDYIEGFQQVPLNEGGVTQSVASGYMEVLHAMQDKIHSGDRRSDMDKLLTI